MTYRTDSKLDFAHFLIAAAESISAGSGFPKQAICFGSNGNDRPIFDRRSAGWLAPFQVLFTRPTWQRLVLHTAAYWLMLTVRDAIPAAHPLARAEFATIRLRLLKLGARIRETAARVRLAFAAASPEADLLRHLATALVPAPA